jgi:uncharacterized protein
MPSWKSANPISQSSQNSHDEEMKDISSSIKVFDFRLKPKNDLKKSILAFAGENKLKAGAIATCVGSLKQLHIRLANQHKGKLKKGFFEVISLTGAFSDFSCHFHISVSDSLGSTNGGHLLDHNLIYTTEEIEILEFTNLEFKRELDPTNGYKELVIARKMKSQ